MKKKKYLAIIEKNKNKDFLIKITLRYVGGKVFLKTSLKNNSGQKH